MFSIDRWDPNAFNFADLRKLEISFCLCRSTEVRSSARRGTFISKVTKLVALRHLPEKGVSVPLSFELKKERLT